MVVSIEYLEELSCYDQIYNYYSVKVNISG